MNIINLTPHTIAVETADGSRQSFASNGVARIATTSRIIAEVNGIPVTFTEFGEVTGLPDPQPDTVYICSMLVAQCAGREDVVGPDSGPSAIRENGQIVAVRGFVRY